MLDTVQESRGMVAAPSLHQLPAKMRAGSGIGVVGARDLPESFREQVYAVVHDLLDRGYSIHSGGALGADQYALEALCKHSAEARAVIFSAWSSIEGFPRNVQRYVEFLAEHSGKVVDGDAPPHSSRSIVVTALLARNQRLVRASAGLVAFLYGDSRGTIHTVLEAIKRKIRVVVYVCGDQAELPPIQSGSWHPLNCPAPWGGAYQYQD